MSLTKEAKQEIIQKHGRDEADTGSTQVQVALLTELGASRVLLENGKLSEAVRDAYPDGIDGVLDIIGNSTLIDSLHMARKGGRVCVAGFLGSSEPIAGAEIKLMRTGGPPDAPAGAGLSLAEVTGFPPAPGK